MSECIKMVWCLTIILLSVLVTLTLSMPYEIVYTGEGCACPKSLGYKINVPKLEKPKEYALNDYGYKIDVPVQAKGRVTYSFDFTVEEPRIPKPPKPTKLNLFAKIDRITMNRGDCVEALPKYPPAPAPEPEPEPAPPSYPCSCGKCGSLKPIYRYVYKKMQPCKCQRPRCNCNSQSNNIPMDFLEYATDAVANLNRNNNIRHKRDIASAVANPDENRENREKRDLQRVFFRNRQQRLTDERPGRFVKLYNKKLSAKDRSAPQFDNNDLSDEDTTKTKQRRGPFDFLKQLRPRLVKRDIKGEYDLIEKEHEEIDLTLPEIIQYMPETLQPNFKRGPCKFGCQCQKTHVDMPPAEGETIATTTEQVNTDDFETTEHLDLNAAAGDNEADDNSNTEQPLEFHTEPSSPNSIDSSNHAKRNAANYNQQYPYYRQPAAPFSPARMQQLPQLIEQNAYLAKQQALLQSKSFNPNIYAPQLPAYQTAPPQQQPPQYVLGQKYLEKDGRLRLIVSDPTGSDGTPLKYAGDLEAPATNSPPPSSISLSSPQQQPRYPVRTISNAALDKVITEIVYRHPDFIDATSHYGGALVDPEPYQEQQTKDFLKKLIDGRLQLWFGDDDDRRAKQATYFTNPYQGPPPSPFGYPAPNIRS